MPSFFEQSKDTVIQDSSFTTIGTQVVDHSTHQHFHMPPGLDIFLRQLGQHLTSLQSKSTPRKEREDYKHGVPLSDMNDPTFGSNHHDVQVSVRAEGLLHSNTDLGRFRHMLQETILQAELPVVQIQTVVSSIPVLRRAIKIRTRIDFAQTKLRRSTAVILTLSPNIPQADSIDGGSIVWKILHFEKESETRHNVTWLSRAGVGLMDVKGSSDIRRKSVVAEILPGTLTVFEAGNEEEKPLTAEELPCPDSGSATFSRRMLEPLIGSDLYALCNRSSSRQRFSLCLFDEERDQFCPVTNLGFIGPDMNDIHVCGSPKMIQAYAVPAHSVNKFQEGQQVDEKILGRPLLLDTRGKPKHADITANEDLAFLLYSSSNGKVVLQSERYIN
ncbi:hypothetical protein CVT26_004699 [Gymnopilus dilepis]|uniref:Uncharacterized protein n=1 Tax=Gymnopilus dilepis TaxID=231916 RepID=A0A409XZ58_9AGAR|nr:hypothetical protein CVT26_004699 [Gymnopilus dilepis]